MPHQEEQAITSGEQIDQSKTADLERVRAAGWTERSAVDYATVTDQAADSGDWFGTAKVYEWKGEYGDVGPQVPELEKILFGGDFRVRQGEHLNNLEFEVAVEGPVKIAPVRKFADAGLHPIVMSNVEMSGYAKPTPIQSYTIPAVLQGTDVIAVAQTGSGKTSAYLIPVISNLMGKASKLAAPRPDPGAPGYDARIHQVKAEPLVVIVVPTRELAIQIFDEARRLCYRSMLRPCVAYGGLPMGVTKDQLGAGCDVLIATPGRLIDLMDKPHILTMARVKYTVIDEADELLHSDWEEELNKIMAGGDTNEDADHVYMMFSATFPKDVRKLASEYMSQDFTRIRIGRAGSSHKNIRQNIIYVDQDNKRQAAEDLLMQMEPRRVLIFCNSKITVDILDDYLYNKGFPTTSIHADRSQREREDSMRNFRTGHCPILIATGISSRGWDVKDADVINYDLPSAAYGGIVEYVHRIGRTARIGHKGLATSFFNDRNDDIAQDLVNVLAECECDIPDFLEQYKPEDGNVAFDDDSDDEADGATSNGGVEGAMQNLNVGGEDDADLSAWDAPAEAADQGFCADANSANDFPPAADGW